MMFIYTKVCSIVFFSVLFTFAVGRNSAFGTEDVQLKQLAALIQQEQKMYDMHANKYALCSFYYTGLYY